MTTAITTMNRHGRHRRHLQMTITMKMTGMLMGMMTAMALAATEVKQWPPFAMTMRIAAIRTSQSPTLLMR